MRYRKLLAKLASSTLAVILIGTVLLVVFRGFRPKGIFYGFIFGVITSAANFWLLSQDISRTRYAPPGEIERWLLARFILRYLVIGIGFLVCLIFPRRIHIVGFLIGFVAFQLTVFWMLFSWWRKKY